MRTVPPSPPSPLPQRFIFYRKPLGHILNSRIQDFFLLRVEFSNLLNMAPKKVLPLSLGVSAILPASLKKRTLEKFQQRSVSMDSRLSTASSVNDFIDLKVENVKAHIADFTSLK